MQLQGKELSYNNLLDVNAAFHCLLDFAEATCVIIKHDTPCGLASAADTGDAFIRAHECDPESAFGGVVGCNRPLDTALAERLAGLFLEVVLAPSVESGAKALLAKKPNLRLVTLDWPGARPAGPEWRQLAGAWLRQNPDAAADEAERWRVATKRQPTVDERRDLTFAWRAVKHVMSNGIIIARNATTLGIGQGQPSRVGSVRLAIQKAGSRSRGSVAASDGFFPFPDNVELLAHAGVTAIIQPGGSIKDEDVIRTADAAGLAMLCTGIRHFRH